MTWPRKWLFDSVRQSMSIIGLRVGIGLVGQRVSLIMVPWHSQHQSLLHPQLSLRALSRIWPLWGGIRRGTLKTVMYVWDKGEIGKSWEDLIFAHCLQSSPSNELPLFRNNGKGPTSLFQPSRKEPSQPPIHHPYIFFWQHGHVAEALFKWELILTISK